MLQWLHSVLPPIPHYGYVLVFIVVFLNNISIPLVLLPYVALPLYLRSVNFRRMTCQWSMCVTAQI